MHLEFQRIEEANDLVNLLLENHPFPLFVANADFKIVFFNHKYMELTHKTKHEIEGHEFCETLGCMQRGELVKNDTGFCKHCQARELLSGSGMSELELIREFVINHEKVMKRLFIRSYKIQHKGEPLKLVLIEDRTSKVRKTSRIN